jgi:hypothetical protein
MVQPYLKSGPFRSANYLRLSQGKLNQNTEPLPNWLTTPIVPPWASTITFAMARPMPVPGAV